MYCTWNNTKCGKSKTMISTLKNRLSESYTKWCLEHNISLANPTLYAVKWPERRLTQLAFSFSVKLRRTSHFIANVLIFYLITYLITFVNLTCTYHSYYAKNAGYNLHQDQIFQSSNKSFCKIGYYSCLR